jgi:hypothetical protein
VNVDRLRAYLDREGNARWYSALDKRGQVLQSFRRIGTHWFRWADKQNASEPAWIDHDREHLCPTGLISITS